MSLVCPSTSRVNFVFCFAVFGVLRITNDGSAFGLYVRGPLYDCRQIRVLNWLFSVGRTCHNHNNSYPQHVLPLSLMRSERERSLSPHEGTVMSAWDCRGCEVVGSQSY